MNKEEIEKLIKKSRTCLECCKSSCYQCRENFLSKEEAYLAMCELEQLENKVKEQEESRQALIELLETQITEDNIICKCNKLTLFFDKMKIEEIKKEIAKIINRYRIRILNMLEGEKK